MPQYVQARGVDPVLAQMQAQLSQSRSQGVERSRLNAAQYMKDFRQDAANAGYSLGEWAKRNEQNVKSALFSLSGMNEDIVETKYQELVNAPENLAQKTQRLEDELVKTTSPDYLFDKPDIATTRTETVTVPGSDLDAQLFQIDEIVTKAKGSEAKNARVFFSQALFNETDFSNLTKEQARESVNYRQGLIKLYDLAADDENLPVNERVLDKDGAITGKGNEKLMIALTSGRPQALAKITERGHYEGVPKDVQVFLDEQTDIFAGADSTWDSREGSLGIGINPTVVNSPNSDAFRNAQALARKAVSGDKNLMSSYFVGWTRDDFEKLIQEEIAFDMHYKELKDLPVPDLKVDITKEVEREITDITKGDAGLYTFAKNMRAKALEQGGNLGAPHIFALEQGQRKAEADIIASQTDAQYKEALTQKLGIEMALAMQGKSGPQQDVISDYIGKQLEDISTSLWKTDWSEASKNKVDAFNAQMQSIVEIGKNLGLAIELGPAKVKDNFFFADKNLQMITSIKSFGNMGAQDYSEKDANIFLEGQLGGE